ncbi:hypothetical protein O6H91_02G028100 [Diphasiastrum complanatum]|uniref:Uncharacterized protein n=1 Tax=Diphasiastrum complanatum TaxID=34168 RepID=A0ACC2EDT1_DIPCM|nr:hypothetical protein O6H91_02G028100 [Diphasiastrum complanatum]
MRMGMGGGDGRSSSASALLSLLGGGVEGGVTASSLSLFSDTNPFRRKPSIPPSSNSLEVINKQLLQQEQKQNERALNNYRITPNDDDAQRPAGSKAEKKKLKKRKQIENPKMDDEQMEKKRPKNEEAGNNSPHKELKDAIRSNKLTKSPAAPLLQQNGEELYEVFIKNTRVIESAEEAKEMNGAKRMKREASRSSVKTMAPKMKQGKDLGITNGRVFSGLPSKIEIEHQYLRSRKSSDIPGKVVEDRDIDSGKAGRSSRTQMDPVKENMKQGPIKGREENGTDDAEFLKVPDFDEKLQRTIFVGNLPLHLKKKALIKEFSQYGAVESARLRSVPLVDTKLPRKAAVITGHLNEARNSVNAYIVFKEHEVAKAALSHNMKEIHERHIRVDFAQAPHKGAEDMSSVNYDPTRSIFIGNLPFDAEDEELYQLFGSSENPDIQVEAVRIVRDRQTSIGKGFAFVLFKTKAGAKFALSRGTLNLRERDLRLQRISASKQTKIRTLGRCGMLTRKIGHGSKVKKQRFDQRSRRPFQEKGIKSLSRSVQSYEGARSSLKEGKPARWTPNLQRRANDNGGNGFAQRRHTPEGSRRVEGKKKRPAVAARKNPALKKPNAGAKNKSAKAGVAGKWKLSKN